MMNDLTRNQKHYLVTLYHLLIQYPNPDLKQNVKLARLADAVFSNYANTLANVKRLKFSGLLNIPQAGYIQFSDKGILLTQHLIYRWRVIESFLVDVLGFKWEEIEQEVRNLYTIISQKLVEEMRQKAGNPTHSPFGERIDEGSGLKHAKEIALQECMPRGAFIVQRIVTRESYYLHRLQQIGLVPRIRLIVIDQREKTGTVRITIAHNAYTLEYELAKHILVSPPFKE